MTNAKEKLPGSSVISLEQVIRVALGILWLIDGILQFQPQMFTKAFVTNILSVNLSGQPSLVAALIHFGITAFNVNMLFANGASALIQVAIGLVLILPQLKKYQRLALYTSIVWSLVVWIFGEGMGNLFTGMASFYTGAPGSVVLYLIVAVFLLYPKKFPLKNLPKVAGILFLLGAILNTFPMFWTKDGFTQMIFMVSTADSVNFIAIPAKALSGIMSSAPVVSNIILVLLLVFFGIHLLTKPKKSFAYLIAVFLVITWWAGQDFGGIQTFPTATATDPNSGLVFLLFLIPIFYSESWNLNFIKKLLPARKNRSGKTAMAMTA